MTAHPKRPESRIDVPLSVWPGLGTTAEIATALTERLTRPGDTAAIVDAAADPAVLAAAGRHLTWVQTSHRVHEAALDVLSGLAPADRSRLCLLHAPRAGLAETLTQFAGRMRLVVAPVRTAAHTRAWEATVGLLHPAGRLALIGNAGIAVDDGALIYQAHLICAATALYERATAAAESLDGPVDLPVALTRTHIDVRLYCRAGAEGAESDV